MAKKGDNAHLHSVTSYCLCTRLCVVARFSCGGHRGVEATYQMLKVKFWWTKMKCDVKAFIKQYGREV